MRNIDSTQGNTNSLQINRRSLLHVYCDVPYKLTFKLLYTPSIGKIAQSKNDTFAARR